MRSQSEEEEEEKEVVVEEEVVVGQDVYRIKGSHNSLQCISIVRLTRLTSCRETSMVLQGIGVHEPLYRWQSRTEESAMDDQNSLVLHPPETALSINNHCSTHAIRYIIVHIVSTNCNVK